LSIDTIMGKTLLSSLMQSQSYDGREFVIVRPGIVASFYLASKAADAAKAIGAAILRYIDFVGRDALNGYLAQDGTIKRLTKVRIDRDLAVFNSVKAKEPGPDLEYTSVLDGSVGPFGLTVVGSDNDDKLFPLSTSLLRLEFPEDALELFGAESLLGYLSAEAESLGAQCVSVGWGLKRAVPFAAEATAAVNAMLPRYLGLDACYNGFGSRMRGRTPSASWLVYIHDPLWEACGGAKRLREVAPTITAERTGSLYRLRAAEAPPIADANRGAADIGALPELARFLKPTRVAIGGLGDNKLDAISWLARFDDMTSKSWNNA
jgi:hypothetical protein